MHSAILANGKLITAKEYEAERHGVILLCMDPTCKVPVHFVKGDVLNTPTLKQVEKPIQFIRNLVDLQKANIRRHRI